MAAAFTLAFTLASSAATVVTSPDPPPTEPPDHSVTAGRASKVIGAPGAVVTEICAWLLSVTPTAALRTMNSLENCFR